MLQLSGHLGRVTNACFSPNGQRLASVSWDDADPIRVWDATSGAELLQLQGHENAAYRLCFSPDGRRLASASDDNTVRVWDPSSGICLEVFGDAPSPNLRDFAAGSTNAPLRAASRSFEVAVEDAKTGWSVAWFPSPNLGTSRSSREVKSPRSCVWTWYQDRYLYLVTLEEEMDRTEMSYRSCSLANRFDRR